MKENSYDMMFRVYFNKNICIIQLKKYYNIMIYVNYFIIISNILEFLNLYKDKLC